MKTMDEALAIVAPAFKTEEEADAIRDKFVDSVQRRQELMAEVRQNEHVAKLVLAIMFMLDAGEISHSEAILSGFTNGMFVGIEMEKAE